jgi:hypothetical protein
MIKNEKIQLKKKIIYKIPVCFPRLPPKRTPSTSKNEIYYLFLWVILVFLGRIRIANPGPDPGPEPGISLNPDPDPHYC